jgi:hypothetical protein
VSAKIFRGEDFDAIGGLDAKSMGCCQNVEPSFGAVDHSGQDEAIGAPVHVDSK